jgi:hypothetical protein
MAVTTVTASRAATATAGVIGVTNWLTEIRNTPEAYFTSSWLTPTGFQQNTAFKIDLSVSRGSTNGQIVRTFLWFEGIDTAVGGGTITAATLKISGSTPAASDTTQDSIIVSASAFGGDGNSGLVPTDYSELSFSDPFSSTLTSWTNTDYNSYTLNSDAISYMNANGVLNCAIINENNDFQGVTPALGSTTQSIATVTAAIPVNLVLTYTATATNVSVTQGTVVSSGDLSAGTPVTYSISNPLSASSYFILETVSNANGFYDSNSPRNLQGTFTLGAGIVDVVSDDYKAGVVVAPGGGNLVFTPTNNVTAATLLLRGTGA